jgi:hypothetical protein
MSTPDESHINDDNLCDISPNFIAEAADLSHHRSPLPCFEDLLAQKESLLLDDGQDDVTPSISKSSTGETSCSHVYTPAATTSLSSFEQHGWAETEGTSSLVK